MFDSAAALGEAVIVVAFTLEDSEAGASVPGACVGCNHGPFPRHSCFPRRLMTSLLRGGGERTEQIFCVKLNVFKELLLILNLGSSYFFKCSNNPFY